MLGFIVKNNSEEIEVDKFNNFISIINNNISVGESPLNIILKYNKLNGKIWEKKFVYVSSELLEDVPYLKVYFQKNVYGYYLPEDENLIKISSYNDWKNSPTRDPGSIDIYYFFRNGKKNYRLSIEGNQLSQEIIDNFELNNDKWNNKNIQNYEFDLEISCFCIGSKKRKLKVIDNKIILISNLDENSNNYRDNHNKTFTDLLEFTKQEMYKDPRKLTINYDDENGYIKELYIDNDDRIADEEIGYKITNFIKIENTEINRPHFVIKNTDGDEKTVNNHNYEDNDNLITFRVLGITKDLPPSKIELSYGLEKGNKYRIFYDRIKNIEEYLIENKNDKCFLKYFNNEQYYYYKPNNKRMLRCYNYNDAVTEDFILGRINIITRDDLHFIYIEDVMERLSFPKKEEFNVQNYWNEFSNEKENFDNLFNTNGEVNQDKVIIGDITIFDKDHFEQSFTIKNMDLGLLNTSQKNDIITSFKNYYLQLSENDEKLKINTNNIDIVLTPGSVNILVKVAPFLYTKLFITSNWYLFSLPPNSPIEGLSLSDLKILYSLMYVENTCWEFDSNSKNYKLITDNKQLLERDKAYWIRIKYF